MNKLLIFLFCTLSSIYTYGQSSQQTRIMVVPFTKDGEDIRTVLDNDVNQRIAVAKVKEGFDNKGFTTVDFVGKLKAARDNQVFTSDNQSDIKAKIIEMAGCDVYVTVEVDPQQDDNGSSVNVILSAYEVSTGNSLANKVGSSGKFFTTDFGKLTSRAVGLCIDDFVAGISDKFTAIDNKGMSVLVDFSFAEGSPNSMNTHISHYENLALSDVLENWISKNSAGGSYHIQGTTDLKMIFDNVKIPLVDKNGVSNTSNKYALDIYKFIMSIGLSATKEIKANTIYITIN